MRFSKPIISFFLFVLILSLSGVPAHAKTNKSQMKYKGMDRNNDGVITLDEWRGDSDKSFNNQDWNGDGVLSGDEVRPGAKRPAAQQQPVSSDQFRILDRDNNGVIYRNEWTGTTRSFDVLDRNRDGKLNRDEFYNRQQYPVSVFRELDQNNDNRISRSEWRGTNDTFSRLDTNGDGYLTEHEFNSTQSSSLVQQIFDQIFGKQ